MDYTVGQLARQCGLSVRTLHHYESIGLLVPSRRSDSGYRLYSAGDVQRLHRIVAYRQLGASLKDIESYLGPNAPPLKTVLAYQREAAEQEAARLRTLVSMIDRLMASPAADDEQAIALQLIDLMKLMQSIEGHFSPAEQQELRNIRSQIAPTTLLTTRSQLTELLIDFRAACENDVDVRSSAVTELARRWKDLGAPVKAHPSLRAKTRSLLGSSAEMQKATGVTPELIAYIDRAIASLGSDGT
jgi:DNA-binding transcriptional MerR regulator